MTVTLTAQSNRPTTPAGYLVNALEQRCTDLDQIKEKYPLVFSAYTDKDIFAMVKNIIAIRGADGSPPAAKLILMEEHVRREHGANHTTHEHGVTGEPEHDHDREIERYREEVKNMPTATATKRKAKAKAEPKEKPARVEKTCHCGCGGKTFGNFQPGHDAKVYSLLKKEAAGEKVSLPKPLTANVDLLATMRSKAH